MKTNIQEIIQEKSLAIFEKVKTYREHMHMYPELSYQEFETMNFVSKTLTDLGISHKTGVGNTGVVALIKNEQHSEDSPCIALRSDLDALPIQEENEVAFKSTRDGLMHACGHDVHTAILLGTAEILHSMRKHLEFPVKLIFQPGEEKNPGGATLMIADGVLRNPNVKEIFALHVFPEMEVGKVGFREGLYMASSDEIHLTIYGKGGHGATPHQCIDPITIGANIVVQLQQIVSRKCDPKIPCVLTFGHFEAIGETNIIPSQAVLKGTFRTMDETWRAEALDLISQQVKSLVESQGGTFDLKISKGYPYLENDPFITSKLKEKAISLLGNGMVEDLPIRLTSEDFSFYSHKVPACFFRLGVRNEEKGIVYGVHHPKFNIDDNALITGIQMMCIAAFN
jgi:amidohydrolase